MSVTPAENLIQCLCGLVIGKEYPREMKPLGRVVSLNQARLIQDLGMAPKLKCRCGKVTVLLKGTWT